MSSLLRDLFENSLSCLVLREKASTRGRGIIIANRVVRRENRQHVDDAASLLFG